MKTNFAIIVIVMGILLESEPVRGLVLPPEVKDYLQNQHLVDGSAPLPLSNGQGDTFTRFIVQNWYEVLTEIPTIAPEPRQQKLVIRAMEEMYGTEYVDALDQLGNLFEKGIIKQDVLEFAINARSPKRGFLARNNQDSDVISLIKHLQAVLPKECPTQQFLTNVINGKRKPVDIAAFDKANPPFISPVIRDPLLDYYQLIISGTYYGGDAEPHYTSETRIRYFQADFTGDGHKTFFITDSECRQGEHGYYAWSVYLPLAPGLYRKDDMGVSICGPDYIGYVAEIKGTGLVDSERHGASVLYLNKGKITSIALKGRDQGAAMENYPQYFTAYHPPLNITHCTLGDFEKKYSHPDPDNTLALTQAQHRIYRVRDPLEHYFEEFIRGTIPDTVYTFMVTDDSGRKNWFISDSSEDEKSATEWCHYIESNGAFTLDLDHAPYIYLDPKTAAPTSHIQQFSIEDLRKKYPHENRWNVLSSPDY